MVHELISKRWSPRAFSDEKVASEILISILEAGRWAASSRNSQPWRFIIAEFGSEYWEDMIRGLIPFNQDWAPKASFIILVVAQVEDANGRARKDYQIDVGLAIGNMSFQASSKNVYLHNMTGIEKDVYRKAFKIPSNFEPLVCDRRWLFR